MMGADFFEDGPPPGLPPVGIGHGCYIRNAIIDKNARIGDGSRLFNEADLWQADGEGWHIREGVIVVPRNVVICAGNRGLMRIAFVAAELAPHVQVGGSG